MHVRIEVARMIVDLIVPTYNQISAQKVTSISSSNTALRSSEALKSKEISGILNINTEVQTNPPRSTILIFLVT